MHVFGLVGIPYDLSTTFKIFDARQYEDCKHSVRVWYLLVYSLSTCFKVDEKTSVWCPRSTSHQPAEEK